MFTWGHVDVLLAFSQNQGTQKLKYSIRERLNMVYTNPAVAMVGRK